MDNNLRRRGGQRELPSRPQTLLAAAGTTGCCATGEVGTVSIDTGGDLFSSDSGTFYLSMNNPLATTCVEILAQP